MLSSIDDAWRAVGVESTPPAPALAMLTETGLRVARRCLDITTAERAVNRDTAVGQVLDEVADARVRLGSRGQLRVHASCDDARRLAADVCNETLAVLDDACESMSVYESSTRPSGPAGVVSLDVAMIGAALADACLGAERPVHLVVNDYVAAALHFEEAIARGDQDLARRSRQAALDALGSIRDAVAVGVGAHRGPAGSAKP